MLKNIIFLLVFLFVGCSNIPTCKNNKSNYYQPYVNYDTTNIQNFNTEQYIWEDFIFTTNTVKQLNK